jgi:hypothetical protein
MKFNFEKPNNNEESNVDKLKRAGKKAVFSAALAAGLSAGSGEAVAQNQDNLEKDKIENVESNNPYEKLVQRVDAKELKNLLKDYKGALGQMPLSMILEEHKDEKFYVSEPTPGLTKSGGAFLAEEKMRLAGKRSVTQYDFYKKTDKGFTYLLVFPESSTRTIEVSVLKKGSELEEGGLGRYEKVEYQDKKLLDLFQEYKSIKNYLEAKDPSEIKTDEDRNKIRKLLDRYDELEKELNELLK